MPFLHPLKPFIYAGLEFREDLFEIKNLRESSGLEIVKNGFKFLDTFLTQGREQRITLSDLPKQSSWYRSEIYTNEGKELLCFTNPINITLFNT